MELSRRAIEIQASPIRKLMPYANDAKKRGIRVYHLNIGQPDIDTPQEMLRVYHEYDEKVIAYGPSQGLDVYRKSLVIYYGKHGIEVTEDDIIVTTAGSEAIVFAMLVACNEGDEIIVPEPFYTNYNGFATMAGVILVPITTYAETGYCLPGIEQFEQLINPRTKAIMLCNPGNPTGTVYSAAEMQAICKFALRHELYVISDEVYREFVYDGAVHTSVMHIGGMEHNGILVDSISKRYSACGARVGCIVSKNKELMAAVLKFAQARLCPPTVDQLASNACVYLPDDYIRGIREEYCARRDLVYEEVLKIPGVICRKPKGAFYVTVKLPVQDAEDFVIWLLKDYQVNGETVMSAPANGFYATPGLGEDELRIAYILNRDDLGKAMHIFRTGFEIYRQRQ